jgi:hypothetical protein
MRHLFILFFILLTSCSTKTKTIDEKNVSSMRFGEELIDVGFLKFADSTQLDSLKFEIINSFYIYNEANSKIAHIDAEELAEFNFDFFVPTLDKMLEKRGFRLDVKTASDYEDTHDILMNGSKIRLYSKDELDNGRFWESAPSNFFREVNNQLDKKGIDESFYLLYTGNDLQAILLTKDEQRIIAKHYKDAPKEIPYLP